MDALFGDATTAMPTPAQQAEVDSLLSARSPVPSLDIRRPGNFTADNAIPGLDINPPGRSGNTEPKGGKEEQSGSEGRGGWISRLKQVARGDDQRGSGKGGGAYGRLRNEGD